jgi:hypothetical protein
VHDRVPTNGEMQYVLQPQQHRQETDACNDWSCRGFTYRTMGEIRSTGVEMPSKFVEVRWSRSENNAVSRKNERPHYPRDTSVIAWLPPISKKYPKAQQTEEGEHDESRKEASGLLLHKPEHERRKESPQAASRSD